MQINIFFINDKWEIISKNIGNFLIIIIASRNSDKILNRTKTDTGE